VKLKTERVPLANAKAHIREIEPPTNKLKS